MALEKKYYNYIRICVVIFYLSCGSSTYSQEPTRDVRKKTSIGICKYKIFYTCRFSKDTIKKEPLYDKHVLKIGDTLSHYSSMLADKADSVWYNLRETFIQPNKNGADGINPYEKAGLGQNECPNYEDVFMGYPYEGISTVMTRIITKEFIYEEPVPKFKWKILSDTITISGYKCKKATTSFRGRDYEVWFTPFIPIRQGPWKFNGLPGLILKAADTKGYFEWIATGIEKSNNEGIYIYRFDKVNMQKTTRKDVLNLLNKQWKDPIGLMFYVNQEILGTGYKDEKTGKLVLVYRGDTYNYQKPYIPQLELE
ncbi:MAG: GLPGLI family protein [Prevotellaceae bacterium]|jgi:GLPGLI family protein|nr:GLPGLI family protein [Prevotellaceae bacterium]